MATANKKKKVQGKYTRTRAEYEKQQQKRANSRKGYWNSSKDKAQHFKAEKMKGYDGKEHTYHVRTDARGRRYILNDGQVAPVGYTQGGKGYYGLKKNLRITEDSSDAQKRFAAAHRAEIFGAAFDGTDMGAIDKMGMRGQNYLENGILHSNFRQATALRKMMNDAEAFYKGEYGHTKHKMSKNMMTFKQDGGEP